VASLKPANRIGALRLDIEPQRLPPRLQPPLLRSLAPIAVQSQRASHSPRQKTKASSKKMGSAWPGYLPCLVCCFGAAATVLVQAQRPPPRGRRAQPPAAAQSGLWLFSSDCAGLAYAMAAARSLSKRGLPRPVAGPQPAEQLKPLGRACLSGGSRALSSQISLHS
jgi:hypothetical protein